jgi:hypothetical protein
MFVGHNTYSMSKNSILIPLSIALLMLGSCTCDWHLQRAKRKCDLSTLSTTVIVHDTVKVPSVQFDTIFHYSQRDTVIMVKDRLTMKYFYNHRDSTVFLDGDCDSLIIIREIPVTVQTTELKEGFGIWFKRNVLWLLAIVVIGGAFILLLRRLDD